MAVVIIYIKEKLMGLVYIGKKHTLQNIINYLLENKSRYQKLKSKNN